MAAQVDQARITTENYVSNGVVNDPAGDHTNGRSKTILHYPFGAVANGHTLDHSNGSGPVPLNIAIVGAGIGGLAAAIGLRRNGHNVFVSFIQPRCTVP